MMSTHPIDKAAIKRAAARSTHESAALEGRTIPEGYARAASVSEYLATLREHT